MDNEAATVLVAVLAVPGVQRLMEAVAVWIESRGKRDLQEPVDERDKGDEGGNVRDGS